MVVSHYMDPRNGNGVLSRAASASEPVPPPKKNKLHLFVYERDAQVEIRCSPLPPRDGGITLRWSGLPASRHLQPLSLLTAPTVGLLPNVMDIVSEGREKKGGHSLLVPVRQTHQIIGF